jgi:hypothetical protein
MVLEHYISFGLSRKTSDDLSGRVQKLQQRIAKSLLTTPSLLDLTLAELKIIQNAARFVSDVPEENHLDNRYLDNLPRRASNLLKLLAT